MISVSQGKLGMCTYSESCVLKLFIQANDQIDGYPLLSHHPHYYLFYRVYHVWTKTLASVVNMERINC